MKYGMGVLVTLVFSDESHREAWAKANVLNTAEMVRDYKRRKESQNLVYNVGPMADHGFLDDQREIAGLNTALRIALKHIPKTDWAVFLENLSPEMRVKACRTINEGILGACPEPDLFDSDEPF